MIKIDKLNISKDGLSLDIKITVDIGTTVTSLFLWTKDNFKDYSLAKVLNNYLNTTSNISEFTVLSSTIGIPKFEDLVFIEARGGMPTNNVCEDCQSPAIGVAYNLTPYYNCLMQYLLDLSKEDCVSCNDNKSKNMSITINMLLDSIDKALDIGYYIKAIEMIDKLKKLCSLKPCTNCSDIDCPKCNNFIQIIYSK